MLHRELGGGFQPVAHSIFETSMHFNRDRCAQCNRPIAEHDGTDHQAWFCSNECYEIALGIPAEFRHGKTPEQSPRFQAMLDGPVRQRLEDEPERDYIADIRADWDRTRADFIRFWHSDKDSAVTRAKYKLHDRLDAERNRQNMDVFWSQYDKKEKEILKMREANDRTMEKLKADAVQRDKEAADFAELIKPRPIPAHLRFEHTHILGPSGSGKTTLIQQILLDDLATPGHPAYIIIDPKGTLVERVSRLAIFNPQNGLLRDRIVIIDPQQKPALNIFDPRGVNPAQIVSTISYVFSTTKQKLTGKQEPCFAFCVSLLFKVPNANLFTLLDLLDDRTKERPQPDPRFTEALAGTTDPAEQRFFETDYYSSSYSSTRQEIKTRIWGILQNPLLSAMFNADTRALDLADCIRTRKIVLVNTRMLTLKEGHQTLGRYILSLAVDAIQSRADTQPVYVVIDELQEFADADKSPEMLRIMREYSGGAILAHQNMYCAEIDDDMRNAISTNTSIKYSSSPESIDLNYMARDLRCEPEFLKSVEHTDTHGRFACFVRGMRLQHPFIVEVPFGNIQAQPHMTDAEYRELIAFNMAHLSATRRQAPTVERPDSPATEASTRNPSPAATVSPSGTSKTVPDTTPDDSDAGEPANKWG
jgi:energy-coupling factor transporter ATP-binding protein EcfA2